MLDREAGVAGGEDPSDAGGLWSRMLALDFLGNDLTRQALLFRRERIVGRHDELRRVVDALSSPVAHSVLLVGEAGVGKTTIAKGVAQLIARGDVPEPLRSRRIVQIHVLLLFDWSSGCINFEEMIKDCRDRDKFLKRIGGILDEVHRSNGTIVVFIEDLSSFAALAGAERMIDFFDLLKSELARGDFQFIGTTTHDNYREFYESYNALNRLQAIVVESPSKADLLEILKGQRGRYESEYSVPITDEALEAAIELAERFMDSRGLPARVISLIEATAAHVGSADEKVETPELKALNDQIERFKQDDESALSGGEYDRAAWLYDQQANLEETKENIIQGMREGNGTINVVVDDEAVAQVVSITTGAWLSVVRTWLRPRT